MVRKGLTCKGATYGSRLSALYHTYVKYGSTEYSARIARIRSNCTGRAASMSGMLCRVLRTEYMRVGSAAGRKRGGGDHEVKIAWEVRGEM